MYKHDTYFGSYKAQQRIFGEWWTESSCHTMADAEKYVEYRLTLPENGDVLKEY